MTQSKQKKLEILKNYLGSVMSRDVGIGGLEVEAGLESLEGVSAERIVQATPLSDQAAHTVQSAVDKLRKNQLPSDDEQFALEAIVFPDKRPVFDIVNDDFTIANPMWSEFDTNSEFHSRLRDVIPSIGRIEVPDSTILPYVGTGFVVGDGLIMTNRHVAQVFASGLGLSSLVFTSESLPAIDFKRERNDDDADRKAFLTFQNVIMIHPYWDMALLRVTGLTKTRKPLTLSIKHPEDALAAQQNIAVIGYPAFSPYNDAKVQNQVFNGLYNVKRLAPGKVGVTGVSPEVTSFGKIVSTLIHDSSTLGGNSGSAVVDVSTGEIIALHFMGAYLKANYAVPSSDLAQDGRVIDAGVNFAKSARRQDGPWEKFWQQVTEAAAPTARPMISATLQSPPETPSPKPPVLRSTGVTESVSWTIPIEITVRIGAKSVGPVNSGGGSN